MKTIGLQPNYPQFENNRLFELEHEYSGYWQLPFAALRSAGRARGYEIKTLDLCAPGECAAAVLMDLPMNAREIREIKARAPEAKWILHLVESPLGRPHWFDSRNHEDFASIVTYRSDICDGRRYFFCPFPVGVAPQIEVCTPFDRRHLLLILNNVSRVGLMANRGHGWQGLPFFGSMFRGYKFDAAALFSQNRGQLLSRRYSLARTAERMGPDLVHMYGGGWNGEQIGWPNKVFRNPPFAGFKGRQVRQFEVLPRYRFFLAFENIRSDVGFITQKIFDAMHAGVVPVYLGDERISELVWPECFVDARQFRSNRELLMFLHGMREPEWTRMRDAGRRFLLSSSVERFSPATFAACLLAAVEGVLNKND